MSNVGGGGEPPHSSGGGRSPPACPFSLRPCMIHRPTYIYLYVNTLLSASVILLHFPRTSEPANTHACFLCVLISSFNSHPSQWPPTQHPHPHSFSQQSEPFGAFAAQVRPAETPDVIMTPVSYFPQVFPERPVNMIRYRQSNSLKVTICRNNVTPLFADAAR